MLAGTQHIAAASATVSKHLAAQQWHVQSREHAVTAKGAMTSQ